MIRHEFGTPDASSRMHNIEHYDVVKVMLIVDYPTQTSVALGQCVFDSTVGCLVGS